MLLHYNLHVQAMNQDLQGGKRPGVQGAGATMRTTGGLNKVQRHL